MQYTVTIYLTDTTALNLSHPADKAYAPSLAWVLAGIAYVVLTVMQLVMIYVLSKVVHAAMRKRASKAV